jgi:hypothetical protein
MNILEATASGSIGVGGSLAALDLQSAAFSPPAGDLDP